MIELRDLTKVRGGRAVVDGVTLTAAAGRITALLGPNGSGKSSTFRMVTGADRPTGGGVLVDGAPLACAPDPAGRLGSVMDGAPAHPAWTVQDHVHIIGASRGLSRARVDEVAEACGLDGIRRRRGRELSLGMRQRLGMALALLGSPRNLVLDEPANGLDPEALRWLRSLVRERASGGGAVLMSSHLMKEIHDIADDLAVIVSGRVVWRSTLTGFLRSHAGERVIVTSPEQSALHECLVRAGATVEVHGHDLQATGISRDDVGLLAWRSGLPVTGLSRRMPQLEQTYLSFLAGLRDEAELNTTPEAVSAPEDMDRVAGLADSAVCRSDVRGTARAGRTVVAV